jgi:hypothetical protein
MLCVGIPIDGRPVAAVLISKSLDLGRSRIALFSPPPCGILLFPSSGELSPAGGCYPDTGSKAWKAISPTGFRK